MLEGEQILLDATAKAGESKELEAASVIHNSIFSGRAVGDDVAILTIGFSSDPGSTGLTISADNSQAAFSGRVARSTTTELQSARSQRLFNLSPLPKELAS